MRSTVQRLWPLFFGLVLLGVATGLGSSLMGLRCRAEGFSGSTFGLILTSYYLGYLGGSLRGSGLISRIGHNRAFAVCAGIVAASNLAIPLYPSPWIWASLQLLVGFSFGIVYVVTESWLNLVATPCNRGRLMALYMVCLMLGLSGGPYLLNVYDAAGYELFSLMSLLVGIAAIPILISSHAVPLQTHSPRLPLLTLWRYAPHSTAALLLVNLLLGGIHGISAMYSAEVGMDTQSTSLFVSLIFFGGFCMQWPLGYLSDRYNRFTVFAVLAFACAFISCVAGASGSSWLIFPLAFVFGGCSFPLYSLCASTIYDRVRADEILPASASVILIGCLGAMGGPTLATGVMEAFGPGVYFLLLGGLSAAAGVLMLLPITKSNTVIATQ